MPATENFNAFEEVPFLAAAAEFGVDQPEALAALLPGVRGLIVRNRTQVRGAVLAAAPGLAEVVGRASGIALAPAANTPRQARCRAAKGTARAQSMRSSSALLQRWPSKRGGWGEDMADSGEMREIGGDGELG